MTVEMIQVRSYHPTDLPACRSLWVGLTRVHRELYGDPTIGGPEPGLAFDAHLARDDLAGLWVAEIGGQVVGMVGLLVCGEEAEIEPLVVASGYRGRGVGHMLIEQARAAARARGTRFLKVRPVARNLAALAFFVAAGFATLGHVELFEELGSLTPRVWLEGTSLHGHSLRY